MLKSIDAFLALRRAVGFQLETEEYLLHDYARWAKRRGEAHVRTRTAMEWAAATRPPWQRERRLRTVATFARHARAEDARHILLALRRAPGALRARAGEAGPAIAPQRTDSQIVNHLEAREQRALLDAPDPATRLGIRDRAMLQLGLAGGLRVSELVGLRLDEVEFNGRYVDLRVRGKGRRERTLTLWRAVGDALRAWLAVRGEAKARSSS